MLVVWLLSVVGVLWTLIVPYDFCVLCLCGGLCSWDFVVAVQLPLLMGDLEGVVWPCMVVPCMLAACV